jgi:hypothetical protein
MADNVDTQFMLTTLDNPYNPFTQFDEWYAFDESEQYCTCEYLARVAKSSPELSDVDQDIAIDLAMNEILQFNLTGNYIKVTKESFKDRLKK